VGLGSPVLIGSRSPVQGVDGRFSGFGTLCSRLRRFSRGSAPSASLHSVFPGPNENYGQKQSLI
jgi:hypothetical protein